MAFAVENLRLKELAIVAEQIRPAFDDFCNFLKSEGWGSLRDFVVSDDNRKTTTTLARYFARQLP